MKNGILIKETNRRQNGAIAPCYDFNGAIVLCV